MDDHDWHVFDVEKGYEVRTISNLVEVRQNGEYKTTLTMKEFDQWCAEGANPEGLE